MQPTMTKSELIELISNKIKLPKGKAEQIVNCIFDSMVDALKKGEGIEIRGFGSFTVREYKSYEGRNPRTGTPVHVAPKRLPFFKVGKELRERVNASAGNHQPGGASGSTPGSSSSSGSASSGNTTAAAGGG
jgi:integration host factor subunit beta